MIKTSDILALGMILVSISIISITSKESSYIKFFGVIGGIMVIISEVVYLFQAWRRKEQNRRQ